MENELKNIDVEMLEMGIELCQDAIDSHKIRAEFFPGTKKGYLKKRLKTLQKELKGRLKNE